MRAFSFTPGATIVGTLGFYASNVRPSWESQINAAIESGTLHSRNITPSFSNSRASSTKGSNHLIKLVSNFRNKFQSQIV